MTRPGVCPVCGDPAKHRRKHCARCIDRGWRARTIGFPRVAPDAPRRRRRARSRARMT